MKNWVKKIHEEYEEKKEIASFVVTAVGILLFWAWLIFVR